MNPGPESKSISTSSQGQTLTFRDPNGNVRYQMSCTSEELAPLERTEGLV